MRGAGERRAPLILTFAGFGRGRLKPVLEARAASVEGFRSSQWGKREAVTRALERAGLGRGQPVTTP
jgi:hypothetical protein